MALASADSFAAATTATVDHQDDDDSIGTCGSLGGSDIRDDERGDDEDFHLFVEDAVGPRLDFLGKEFLENCDDIGFLVEPPPDDESTVAVTVAPPAPGAAEPEEAADQMEVEVEVPAAPPRRGRWTNDETNQLFQFAQDGEGGWAEVARALGRDEQSCHKHWLVLKKKMRAMYAERTLLRSSG